MTDIVPGQITYESGWSGYWITITREEYHALIEENGGLAVLTVYSSCTRVDPGDYFVLTTWGRKDSRNPLVQNVLKDCLPFPVSPDKCTGTHTYSRFVYAPVFEED